MAVHAHPDDEVLYTGGVLAKYSNEGVRTVVVTCTLGQAGSDAAGRCHSRESLGEMRQSELRSAARVLGVSRLYTLGYLDSGKISGSSDNHAACFSRTDTQLAVGRLVNLIRQERPDVLMSYDENGDYGHPDHVKAHEITVAAFGAAALPTAYPNHEPPWRVSKLYYVYSRPSMQLKAVETRA